MPWLRPPHCLCLILALAVAGCGAAGPSPAAPRGQPSEREVAGGSKRVTAALQGEPEALYSAIVRVGALTNALQPLVNAGLTVEDDHGNLLAQLADEVPTIENGLWKVFPDGRMETRWPIKPTAQWHDGTPLTAADFVFTAQVVMDKELPVPGNVAYTAVESVDAPDPRTVLVRWRAPFIGANALFGAARALPLPKHLLERGYVENKAGFVDLPFWTAEFIGAAGW